MHWRLTIFLLYVTILLYSQEVRIIKLDYSITEPEERKQLVEQILAETPDPSEKYLEILADYLVSCMEKQEKKEKKILTDNRLSTVNKRERSLEGLALQFENGEDGIYNIITEDKNIIFQPKVIITNQDLIDIPLLAQLRESIDFWEKRLKTAAGHDAYVIKHTLIDLRKDQYIIKNAYRRPVVLQKITRSRNTPELADRTHEFDEKGYPIPEGITLLDPKVVSAILCNYSDLKQDSSEDFENDTWYLIYDFENMCDKALKDYPLYMRVVEYKIDGLSNAEIQSKLQEEFGIKHTYEYISSLWRKKIPKLIAAAAEDAYLQWYYTMQKRGKYKRCSRCGQIKLAHQRYFSLNRTSKDGYYSICKECRNRKKGE